jgi:hypothetical protein
MRIADKGALADFDGFRKASGVDLSDFFPPKWERLKPLEQMLGDLPPFLNPDPVDGADQATPARCGARAPSIDDLLHRWAGIVLGAIYAGVVGSRFDVATFLAECEEADRVFNQQVEAVRKLADTLAESIGATQLPFPHLSPPEQDRAVSLARDLINLASDIDLLRRPIVDRPQLPRSSRNKFRLAFVEALRRFWESEIGTPKFSEHTVRRPIGFVAFADFIWREILEMPEPAERKADNAPARKIGDFSSWLVDTAKRRGWAKSKF